MVPAGNKAKRLSSVNHTQKQFIIIIIIIIISIEPKKMLEMLVIEHISIWPNFILVVLKMQKK